jgi:hypothetical protein
MRFYFKNDKDAREEGDYILFAHTGRTIRAPVAASALACAAAVHLGAAPVVPTFYFTLLRASSSVILFQYACKQA